MKNLTILSIFFLITFSDCWKETEVIKPILTQEQQLPPKTQEGKNIFGCLVNGKAYVLCASWESSSPIIGSGNPLNIETDFNEIPFFYFRTDDRCTEDTIEQLETIDMAFKLDSLNRAIWKSISYVNFNPILGFCNNDTDYRHFDTLSSVNFIRIDKFHKTRRIISGQFAFDLYTPGCTDTLHLRKGRFDIKY
jgi:hypothetical protein